MGGVSIRTRRRAPLVLLVEDDELVRDLFGASLESAGMRVEHAACREDAMRSASRIAPDVVVIDRHLPDGDGWELVDDLRRRAGDRDLIVVAVTAHRGLRAAERALIAGCDAFLEKPCEPIALVENVRSLLAARAPIPDVRRTGARDT